MINIKQDAQSKRVYLNIDNITRDVRRGIRQAYYLIGKDLQRYTSQKILDKPKSGKTYIVYKGKRKNKHVASAPGEFPANLSSALRKSLNFQVRGWQQLEYGAKAPYARRLELGDDVVAARPYLISSIKDKERNAINFFYSEIDKALKK